MQDRRVWVQKYSFCRIRAEKLTNRKGIIIHNVYYEWWSYKRTGTEWLTPQGIIRVFLIVPRQIMKFLFLRSCALLLQNQISAYSKPCISYRKILTLENGLAIIDLWAEARIYIQLEDFNRNKTLRIHQSTCFECLEFSSLFLYPGQWLRPS